MQISAADVEDELAIAKYAELKKYVPPLYVSLIVTSILLASTHYGIAPEYLTLYTPAILASLMFLRLVTWLRGAGRKSTAFEARKALRRLRVLAAAIAIVTLAWALALFRYGATSPSGYLTTQGHVVLCVALTVLSCIFLLKHEPIAAVTVALLVTVPACAFLLLRAGLVEMAVSLNLAVVAAALVYVVLKFSVEFRKMITTQLTISAVSAENARLAHADLITGLANRRAFFARLTELSGQPDGYVVLTIDLDGFKQLNDQHGHVFGDTVLAEVGRRIVSLTEGYLAARLGGDEFGIALAGRNAMDAARALAAHLIEAISTPFAMADIEAAVGASIGISQSVHSDPSFSSCFERADYALYDAKRTGRGKYVVFDENHARERRETGRIEQSLKQANFEEEFAVVYQPIFDARSARITAVEALIRWTTPDGEAISPAVFIPIAEKTGLIRKITNFVVNRVLSDSDHFESDICFKINISAVDLANEEHIAEICNLVYKSKLQHNRITFEITETAFAVNFEDLVLSINRLQSIGCGIALDDFGIEYSSLRYVQKLAPKVIKIDKSFIDMMESDSGARNIVKTIIDLARNVGAKTVAEGVETEGQVILLRHIGCDELQGFFLSKPVSFQHAIEMTQSSDVDVPKRAGGQSY